MRALRCWVVSFVSAIVVPFGCVLHSLVYPPPPPLAIQIYVMPDVPARNDDLDLSSVSELQTLDKYADRLQYREMELDEGLYLDFATKVCRGVCSLRWLVCCVGARALVSWRVHPLLLWLLTFG